MARATTRETFVNGYGEEEWATVERRPRRRRSGWATLLAILLVLGAILVVGDRVAAQYAEREVRTQVVAALSERGVEYDSADVNVGGFPFLTQVADGRYEEITIDLTNVRLSAAGRNATLPRLNVVASGVKADTMQLVQGTANAVAERVTGSGLVTFATLESLVDYSRYNLSDVKFGEADGALQITANGNVAGFRLPLAATAEITVVEGQFQVRLRDARAVGVNAPAAARNYLENLAERSAAAQLPQLPFDLTLDAVDVQTDGLAITATARDVPLAS
jgi:hypothetical protein